MFTSTILLCADCLFWELSSYPAVFGQDVKLFCNASSIGDCCKTKSRRWNGGPEQVTLTLNEISSSSKYTSTMVVDGFTLVIRDFSEKDINILYTCSYGFQHYEHILSINNSFEKYPTILHALHHNRVLGLSISLRQVYPIPSCVGVFNENDISDSLVMLSSKETIFYNTEVTYNGTEIVQCGVLAVNCTVGSRSFQIINETIGNCAPHEESQQVSVWIPLLLGITLLCLVVCSVLVVKYRKYHGRSSSSRNNAKGNVGESIPMNT